MKIIASFLLISQLLAYDYWPTNGWRTRSLANAGIDQDRFADFIDYVFAQDSDFQSNTLVVIKDGYLVYERYVNGFTQNNKQPLWSISKSITGTLIGIAQTMGYLHLTQPVSIYMKVPPMQMWEEMKIDHLMRMRSGIDWQEGYIKNPLDSNLVQAFYLKGHKNFIKYLLSLPIVDPSGEAFRYSTGDSNLLAHLLGKALGSNKEFFQFADRRLWNILGITNYTIEGDRAGNFHGGAYYYLTPRDTAKFGLLQLHRGTWDGQQVYSPSWYHYFTTASSAWQNARGDGEVYGAHWWLNVDTPHLGPLRPYPAAPPDTLRASGIYGQELIIIPSLGLVLVRHGLDRKQDEEIEIDINKMLELLIRSL